MDEICEDVEGRVIMLCYSLLFGSLFIKKSRKIHVPRTCQPLHGVP